MCGEPTEKREYFVRRNIYTEKKDHSLTTRSVSLQTFAAAQLERGLQTMRHMSSGNFKLCDACRVGTSNYHSLWRSRRKTKSPQQISMEIIALHSIHCYIMYMHPIQIALTAVVSSHCLEDFQCPLGRLLCRVVAQSGVAGVAEASL